MIGLRSEFPQRSEQLARRTFCAALHAGGALEQVGPADVSHKDEIASQCPNRVLTPREIGYEKTQVLRSVARRVCGAHANLADVDVRAIPQQIGALECSACVAPLFPTFTREMKRGAGSLCQCVRSREEI